MHVHVLHPQDTKTVLSNIEAYTKKTAGRAMEGDFGM